MDTVDGLLGLVRRSPLGFLMQDGNQSPDGHMRTDIRKDLGKTEYSFHSNPHVDQLLCHWPSGASYITVLYCHCIVLIFECTMPIAY